MEAEKLPPHSYAYTQDGKKVYIEALTQDGDYVVSGMIAQIYGDEVEEDRGSTWIHNGKLYPKPPVSIVDEAIKAQKAELAQLREERGKLTSGAYAAEREVADRLNKLAKYKGLERLEDFIEGRITHVVIEELTDFKIVPFSDLTYYEDRSWNRKPAPDGIRLVTLFGKSNGDLQWRVNEYKDGSGSSWKRIEPCMSLEEAEAKRTLWAYEYLEKRREYASVANFRPDIVSQAVALAQKYGAEVPADLQVIADQHAADSKAKALEKIKAEIEERNKQLADLSAASRTSQEAQNELA